jgi:RHS repeat-associated protein
MNGRPPDQEAAMAKLAVRMTRDLRGRVTSVGTAEAPQRFAAYAYRADSSVAKETLGAGTLSRSFAYDAMGRLATLDDPAFSVVLGYRVDGKAAGPYADGRVTAEATQWKPATFAGGNAPGAASRTYGFDKFGRLATATSPDRPAQALQQGSDGDGNILSREVGGAKPSTYDYGPGTNRLKAVTPPAGAAVPLAHDQDGAVSVVGTTAIRHDGPGGRASQLRTQAASLAYQASADGERVLKRVTGEDALKRLTVRSGAATLMEVDSEGRQEIYVRGPTGLVALVVDGEDHAVSQDQRGSIRAGWAAGKAGGGRTKRAAAAAPVAVSFDYLPFGALDTGNSRLADPLAQRIRRRYTGQEWEEETGLYNYHARLYDPALARFLSPDPAGQGASPYAYVGGDPISFVDPTGRGKTPFDIHITDVYRFHVVSEGLVRVVFLNWYRPLLAIEYLDVVLYGDAHRDFNRLMRSLKNSGYQGAHEWDDSTFRRRVVDNPTNASFEYVNPLMREASVGFRLQHRMGLIDWELYPFDGQIRPWIDPHGYLAHSPAAVELRFAYLYEQYTISLRNAPTPPSDLMLLTRAESFREENGSIVWSQLTLHGNFFAQYRTPGANPSFHGIAQSEVPPKVKKAPRDSEIEYNLPSRQMVNNPDGVYWGWANLTDSTTSSSEVESVNNGNRLVRAMNRFMRRFFR